MAIEEVHYFNLFQESRIPFLSISTGETNSFGPRLRNDRTAQNFRPRLKHSGHGSKPVLSSSWDQHPGVSWNRGTPSHHPFLDGISHYIPSILGTPNLGNPHIHPSYLGSLRCSSGHPHRLRERVMRNVPANKTCQLLMPCLLWVPPNWLDQFNWYRDKLRHMFFFFVGAGWFLLVWNFIDD